MALGACAHARPAPIALTPHLPPTAVPHPTLRLPAVARPLRYDLELWLDPRAAGFHGKVGIDLEMLAPSSVVWLNATDLAIDEASLDGAPARVVQGGDDFVGFAFDRPIAQGKLRLSIAYHGTIVPNRSRGIYAAREGDGESYLYTFFEPIDARRAFPCFDEPAYKVPWKLSFHVPQGDVALGNAPIAAQRDEGKGRIVELAESKPLPSYLVAFVVGPFDVIDAGTAGHFGTRLRFVVPRGRGGETGYAAKVTPRIVGLLEDYFGMPYPYGKLDVAVVPRYWGTMEHPGILAMGQPLTLIKPGEQSVQREQFYADIAAHELAHYWFGDYVTMARWDDTWLNEALGQWMDARITDQLEPRWSFGLKRVDEAAYGMQADALTTAKKIRQRVDSKDGIANAFDNNITYYKGQAVIAMFEAWLTTGKFQRAIRAFMASHAWGNATADDFFAALDAEQPGTAAALRTFVEQPGVPPIAMKVVCHGDRREVEVTQRRYLPLGATAGPERWKLPVCLRYGKGKGTARACGLLNGERATIPIDAPSCPTSVIGNADGVGYYHVAYAPTALHAALAPSSEITTAERVTALHDAAGLVAAGALPLGDALGLAADTATARERHIVQAGLDLARLARESAMNDAEAGQLQRFLRATYGRKARALGAARRADDGIDESLLRPAILSAVAIADGDPELRKHSLGLAFSWLREPVSLAPELVSTVLEAAAKTNDHRLFAAILEKAKSETDHRKIGKLLSALGGFTNPALVRQAQALLAGTTFDIRESIGILRTQFDDRATRGAAWEFLKASFDALGARMRADEVTFNLLWLVESFCDEGHQRDVEQFFMPRASRFDGGPRVVANQVEAIGQCADTFRSNRPSIDAFLSRY